MNGLAARLQAWLHFGKGVYPLWERRSGGQVSWFGGGMFLAYALGMGTILTGLAPGAALARGGMHAALRKLAPYVSRVSGGFLFASGAYLIYYWTFFLLPGSARRTAGKGPIEFIESRQSRLNCRSGGRAWVTRSRVV